VAPKLAAVGEVEDELTKFLLALAITFPIAKRFQGFDSGPRCLIDAVNNFEV
jgi:hypothetical protein